MSKMPEPKFQRVSSYHSTHYLGEENPPTNYGEVEMKDIGVSKPKGAEKGKQPSIQNQGGDMEENGRRWKIATISQRGNNVQYKTACAPRKIRAVILKALPPMSS